MIKTDAGFKVIMDVDEASIIDDIKKPFVAIKDGYDSTAEGISSINSFFSDMKNEGLWYAITGQYFGEWVNNMFVSFINWLVDMSDLLIVAGMVVLLLIMFGSKRSRKWMYWVVCAYIMFQILGLMV